MIPRLERVLRDLKWVLSSPSLMDHPAMVDSEALAADLLRFKGTLARLGRPGSPLEKAVLDRADQKLGAYFENLLFTWLREIGPARVFARNLQVKGVSGSVGEFDVLFGRDGVNHHWEVAVKFYLGHPGPDGEPYWYGPNPADRLDLKWDRMRHHQLKLSQMPSGRSALETLGLVDVEAAALVRGRLFEPLDPRFGVPHHPDAHPDGLRGFWVHASGVPGLDDVFPGLVWHVLPRLWWLASVTSEDVLPRFNPDLLSEQRHPIHIVGTDLSGHEVTRGFIVPASWPGA